MKFRWSLAFALVMFLALLSSRLTSAQTPIYVGKCNSKTWKDDCTGAHAPLCPSGGAVNCTMLISDTGGYAIATQQGASPSSYICVEPTTHVYWVEGNALSFVVDFGDATTPFTTKSVFTGKSGIDDNDTIVTDPTAVPECNEYVILHCGPTTCTMGDPIVVVHGGQSIKRKKDHEEKPHGGN